MLVQSYAVKNDSDLLIKKVNKEVKFWARNGRLCPLSGIMHFDVKINGTFYFFSYNKKSGNFLYDGKDGVVKIGSCVPRVYYTVDGLQFCVTEKGRLWVKQL